MKFYLDGENNIPKFQLTKITAISILQNDFLERFIGSECTYQ
jgi:hypothetical protein